MLDKVAAKPAATPPPLRAPLHGGAAQVPGAAVAGVQQQQQQQQQPPSPPPQHSVAAAGPGSEAREVQFWSGLAQTVALATAGSDMHLGQQSWLQHQQQQQHMPAVAASQPPLQQQPPLEVRFPPQPAPPPAAPPPPYQRWWWAAGAAIPTHAPAAAWEAPASALLHGRSEPAAALAAGASGELPAPPPRAASLPSPPARADRRRPTHSLFISGLPLDCEEEQVAAFFRCALLRGSLCAAGEPSGALPAHPLPRWRRLPARLTLGTPTPALPCPAAARPPARPPAGSATPRPAGRD